MSEHLSTSEADPAAQPAGASRKVYVTGSRPDLRVPFREVSLSDSPGDVPNPPVRPLLILAKPRFNGRAPTPANPQVSPDSFQISTFPWSL